VVKGGDDTPKAPTEPASSSWKWTLVVAFVAVYFVSLCFSAAATAI
jgi:hypothetical protein